MTPATVCFRSVRSYDFTFKSPRAGEEMFGNFNSSGSCLKKKKRRRKKRRKGGFIYSTYSKLRWPQVECLLSNRSIFLAPFLPPPPTSQLKQGLFHNLLLSPPPNFFSKFSSSPLPSLPKEMVQVANYEGAFMEERNALVKQLLFLFFFFLPQFL